MAKFAAFLDGVFGLSGRTPVKVTAGSPAQDDARSLAAGIIAAPVLQRDETRVQPYSLKGPNDTSRPKPIPAPQQTKLAVRLASPDVDWLQPMRARASFVASLMANDERTADITARLESTQPPTVSTTTIHELAIANQRILPAAGRTDILDSRSAILSAGATNRRTVVANTPKTNPTWQEFLAITTAPDMTIGPDSIWPKGKPVAEATVASPLSLMRGDSNPATFGPRTPRTGTPLVFGEGANRLVDKARGVQPITAFLDKVGGK